jgi:Peroxiredoxin
MRKNTLVIVLILILLPLFLSCHRGESDAAAGADGNYAEDFSLLSFDGSKKVELSDFKGKPIVLNFWASWCVPCRGEMPFFEQIWREYKDKGVVFLGIAVLDQEKSAKEFLKQLEISYINLYDPSGEVANAYGAVAVPTTFFINSKGKIVRKSYGGFVGEEGEKKFTGYVEELIK